MGKLDTVSLNLFFTFQLWIPFSGVNFINLFNSFVMFSQHFVVWPWEHVCTLATNAAFTRNVTSSSVHALYFFRDILLEGTIYDYYGLSPTQSAVEVTWIVSFTFGQRHHSVIFESNVLWKLSWRERETFSPQTDCGLTSKSFLKVPNRAFSYYFGNPGLSNGNTYMVSNLQMKSDRTLNFMIVETFWLITLHPLDNHPNIYLTD